MDPQQDHPSIREITVDASRWLIIATLLAASVATPAGGAEEQERDPIVSAMLLWEYDDPRQSALFFTSLLDEAKSSDNRDYFPVLLTQMARAYGLQGNLSAAHEQLNQVVELLGDYRGRAWVFYLLERGRLHSRTGDSDLAAGFFSEAYRVGVGLGDDYLTVDAALMMALAVPVEEQLLWLQRGMRTAENSESEFARRWLGTLYNNLGWTLFDQREYDEALVAFRKSQAFRLASGQKRREQIASWAVGRTLRALGRLEEALDTQTRLLDERTGMGQSPDGRVVEEIAEIYHAQENPVAHRYFGQAYRLLSGEPELREREPDRLERLKRLSDGSKD
ncbi:MAG: tetratricopeptide repeat protein [Proteobacteria bacterium]|jgi:tetratricopeptide (TPR) repeat protein|nr:tetratricopeptide repeat protein [Pseudomonadota bacterium]MDA1301533.1 tetratricopeptide repeat protein [Pseudomonadota bacterium]